MTSPGNEYREIRGRRPLTCCRVAGFRGAAAPGGPETQERLGLGARRRALTLRRAATMARAGVGVRAEEMLAEAAAPRVGPVRPEQAAPAAPQGCGAPAPGAAMPPPPPRQPSVRFLSAQLGVSGPLGGPECRDRWSTEPSLAETEALGSLRRAADRRVDTASAGGEAGPGHLRTALGWLRRFVEVFPSRLLFVPHEGAGDVRAAAYNEETFRMLGEFMREHGSVRPGRVGDVLSAATIGDYISALRAHRSLQAGYNLLVGGGNLRLPKQLQQMRREDGPSGQRALSRGMTSRLLRRLLPVGAFERHSRRGRLRWAVLWVGHNLLLRGGEVGRVESRGFDPAAGITLADVDWVPPCEDTAGYEVVVVEVMPVKDARVSRSRVPLVIRRRSAGSFTGRASQASPCAWEALRAWWEMRSRECHRASWGSQPLFATLDGSPVCTSDVLEFVREAAAALGCSASDFDSHSLRIGGATDLHHLFGGADAERIIQKRGRWCSMIHQIYARMSASEMLSVSARMLDADGVDMEAFRHGYVMPAVCHARPRG